MKGKYRLKPKEYSGYLSGGLLQAMPNLPALAEAGRERMKADWVCDEEGLICSVCGKDIYHCECPDGNGGQVKWRNAGGRGQ